MDVDWQLYLLAPTFLLFLPKKTKVGIGILIAGLTVSVVAPLWLTLDKKLPSSNFNGLVSISWLHMTCVFDKYDFFMYQ